ncbi:hypothetical protein E8E12_011276 [Didymella heteroderae]|uniref:Uncharacterized protein n=1 Tax=Didymella heteroderae TaxID=1769908 RepID=A0A9P5C4K8_9PLEO|nr:hypothetical protein E8E12_011276 [Didymella heteroderae]
MSSNHLLARQTPEWPANNWGQEGASQPTTSLALSTTFTPPSSCALPSQINILPPPGCLIWWNEPVPFPGRTIGDCYPTEFLRSYTSIPPTTLGALGSSIVPAMSPLVCPQSYCTQYVGDDSYIACCPSKYKFAITEVPVLSERPAYGGVCYTDIAQGEELTAMVYDSKGSARQEIWSPSTTGAQGWAHPIDGWAASSATAGYAVKKDENGSGSSSHERTASSQRPLSSIVDSGKNKAKKASSGVIAGAVLGALVALIAILRFVLFLLRRRKRAKTAEGGDQSDGSSQVEGTQIHQKDGNDARVEVNVMPYTELDVRKDYAHEMSVEQRVSELSAGPDVRRSGR